jgi:WD repeat-containing protein 68
MNNVERIAEMEGEVRGEIMTCGDWSPLDENMVMCGTTEGAVSIFDVSLPTCISRIVAHDHQVNTVTFCPASPSFLTGGLEGSVRFFDLRDLMSSYVYFQTAFPVLKVAISKVDPIHFAVFAKDGQTVSILDTRQPGMPYNIIHHINGAVTCMSWSNLVGKRVFSADISGDLMVSELVDNTQDADSKLVYKATSSIQNLALGSGILGLVTDSGIEFVSGLG